MRCFYYCFYVFFICLIWKNNAFGAHGVSIDGSLEYPVDFKKFNYTSENAQKGGELILHSTGSFDKMNPFTLKGTAAEGLLNYVFEPLAIRSHDEPFAQYGLIAKNIEVAEDRLSVTYTIDEKAHFSDGSAITSEDIKFTIDMLKSDKVHPFYRYYYEDIKNSEILDTLKIKVNFLKENRELALITGEISILSKKYFNKYGFENKEMIKPVGSGPYIVESFNPGQSIIYTKNDNYWAVDHPARKNMYNFDRIKIKYYKDPVVAVEAFKAGEFDLMLVNVAKQWARDMDGPKFDNGKIKKNKFPHNNNAGMQGFVMNTRKSLFKDPIVRKAISMAFNFEWTNKTIFYNQYVRNQSYFSNSYLAATGLPSDEELELLVPLKSSLPEEVFEKPMGITNNKNKGQFRNRLRIAADLLKKNGWILKDEVLQNSEGMRLSFEILLVNQVFERVMAGYVDNLKKIGVEATYRTIDPTLYTERINDFDFDMCVYSFGQSLSPGNEQKNFWHSESADRKGSRNLAGIKNKGVDALVEKIIYADNKESLITATKALDRALWYGYYVVPNWYLDGYRIAYHDKFMKPEKLPLYYDYNTLIMTWWAKQAGGSVEKR